MRQLVSRSVNAFENEQNGAYVLSGMREMHMMSKSSIITRKREDRMVEEKMAPIHPGEILKEDFIAPMGISQYLLAKDIGVDPRRINAIIHGKRAITADTALRLGRYFGIEPEFWMNLQTHYDLEVESDRLAGKLEQEVKIHSAA